MFVFKTGMLNEKAAIFMASINRKRVPKELFKEEQLLAWKYFLQMMCSWFDVYCVLFCTM